MPANLYTGVSNASDGINPAANPQQEIITQSCVGHLHGTSGADLFVAWSGT